MIASQTMSQEASQRGIKELLASGPPTEWYAGYGRTDTGVTGVWYSHTFNTFANGIVARKFEEWYYYGQGLRLGLNAAGAEVKTLSGFTPEEILAKKNSLLVAFSGQTTAPFETYLIEPRTVPSEPPPVGWFVGLARSGRGIIKVVFNDVLKSLNGGEVGNQLGIWGQYINDAVATSKAKKARVRAMEEILFAEHFVKSVTGYYPEELQARRDELIETYTGQELAPFAIEYLD